MLDHDPWQELASVTATGTYTDGPDKEKVQIIQLDTSVGTIRQRFRIPKLTVGEQFAVRCWAVVVSGSVDNIRFDVNDGTAAGTSTAIDGTWREFTAICTAGTVSANGHVDFGFTFSSGTPTVAITRCQAVRGSVQIEYQKTEGASEEAAFCYTERNNKPSYNQPKFMQSRLNFRGIVE